MKRILSIILLALVVCLGLKAQGLMHADEKQDSITVSLITYYPGEQIYELYGHSGLRVAFPMVKVCCLTMAYLILMLRISFIAL